MPNREDFVSDLRASYYGDSALLPVPEYLLDAAMGAVFAVILERGRSGLPTYLEGIGTFFPYVRPGREWVFRRQVKIAEWPLYKEVEELKSIPDRRWLYFRGAKVSAALLDFAKNAGFGAEYASSYAGEEGGVYKQGRAAVWAAVRAELSKVTKGREWGGFFVYDGGGLVASPRFVNGFFARVAVHLAQYYGAVSFRGFGGLGAAAEWVKVVNPATGRAVYRRVPVGFAFERFRGGMLG